MPQPQFPPSTEDPDATGRFRPVPSPRPHVVPPPARPRPAAPHPAEYDSTGRRLAVRLPEWDLLPPAEFLDRRPGARR